MTTANDTKRLTAYVPTDLYWRMKEQSKAENRTMSNYIETMIRRAFEGQEPAGREVAND